jgi:hypothetical protein
MGRFRSVCKVNPKHRDDLRTQACVIIPQRLFAIFWESPQLLESYNVCYFQLLSWFDRRQPRPAVLSVVSEPGELLSALSFIYCILSVHGTNLSLSLRIFLTFFKVRNIICRKYTFLLSIFKLMPNTQNTTNPHEVFLKRALECQLSNGTSSRQLEWSSPHLFTTSLIS